MSPPSTAAANGAAVATLAVVTAALYCCWRRAAAASGAGSEPMVAAGPAREEPTCAGPRAAGGFDTGEEVPGEAPRRLRKAETVLQRRTGELLLVLEASYDLRNQAAVLRTADCLGIQNAWIVEPVAVKGSVAADSGAAPSPNVVGGRRPQRLTQKARAAAKKREQVEAQMAQVVRQSMGDGSKRAPLEPVAHKTAQVPVSTKIARQSAEWLTLRTFADTSSCIRALRKEGYAIWVTCLAQGAASLTDPTLQVQHSIV
eukprot:COSAG01_NODE_10705_length_2099_cov_3.872500_2_plen_258_part_00